MDFYGIILYANLVLHIFLVGGNLDLPDTTKTFED